MADLGSMSAEEFKRAISDAFLEASRLAQAGVGPSVGAGGSGARNVSPDVAGKDFAAASAEIKRLTDSVQKSNKGLNLFRRITEGQGANTQAAAEGFKDLDETIKELTMSGNAYEATMLSSQKEQLRNLAIYKTNVGLASNTMMRMSKVVTGTVVPGLFNVAKGLQDGADAADIASSMLDVYVNAAEQSLKVMSETAKEAGQALSNMGGTAGKVGAAMTILGPIIESIAGAGAKLAKEMIDMSKIAYKRNLSMFNSLTQAGGAFADGLEGMRKGAYGAGMTTEQFSRVLQKNSATFAESGLGVTEAAKLMGGAMQAGGKSMKTELLALGYGFEEQGELMAETMAMMRRGGQVGPGDEAAIAQNTKEYANNLKLIGALTGDDARKRMASAKEANNELAFRAKLAQMGPEQAQMVEQATAKMSAIEAKAFREKMVYGQIVSKDAAAFASMSAGFNERIEQFSNSATAGTLNVQKVADIQADTADQIRKEILARGPDIGAAAMAGVGGLAGEVSKSMVGMLDDTVKQTKTALDNARKNVEGQVAQGTDPTTETGKIVQNTIESQQLIIKQQQITDQLVVKYSDVISLMNKDIEALQKKVTEFSKMSVDDMIGAFKLTEGIGYLTTAIGALTVAMTMMPGKLGLGKLGGNLLSKAGSAGQAVAGVASKGAGAAGGLLKGGAKLLGGAAKFAGPVGLAITAGMSIFDGFTAGIEEYKKSGNLKGAVREGLAGAASSLTFGLIDQETISAGLSKVGGWVENQFGNVTAGWDEWKNSGDIGKAVKAQASGLLSGMTFGLVSKETIGEGLDTIGEWTSKGWQSLKENVDLGAIKDKVGSIAKSVTGAVGNFFGGLFGGSEKEASKDTAAEATKDPKQVKIDQLKSRIARLKEQQQNGPQGTFRAKVRQRDLERYENQLNQLQASKTVAGVDASKTVSAQTGKPLEEAKQTEMAKQAAEAKKKAEAEQLAKVEEAKKKEAERLTTLPPQELTNELLRQVIALLDDSANSQRTLARNSV